MVADLDGDGITEIVVAGGAGTVAAYEFRGHRLRRKDGWPASTCSGGQCPEARGMAAADLDGNGTVEVVVTTTNTSSTRRAGVRVHGQRPAVPAAPAATARPGRATTGCAGAATTAASTGSATTGTARTARTSASATSTTTPSWRSSRTFDNHQINAFNHDGTSILASPWFTNRDSRAPGPPDGLGPVHPLGRPGGGARGTTTCTRVPGPARPGRTWLQWTASPPSVADLDGDGRNEVVGVPNAELHIPYRTQGYAFMVLDGAHGDGSRSARRHAGFETLPMSDQAGAPAQRRLVPALAASRPRPSSTSRGDARPEIVSALPGGKVYAVGPDGQRDVDPHLRDAPVPRRSPPRWSRPTSTATACRSSCSAPTRSARPSGTADRARGRRHAGSPPPGCGTRPATATGSGSPAAPSIGDLTGNGTLEIVLTTFDHGVDVFTVPGSGTGCLPWPTGRGNLLRNGMGPATAP